MSNPALTWAYAQTTGGGPGRKSVLIALADMADEEHSCYPGQARLAQMTEQSERSVRGHLKALVADGFLTRAARFDKSGHRTSDRYVLPVQVAAGIAGGKKRQRKNQPAEDIAAGQSASSPPADSVVTTGRSRQVTQREPLGEPTDTPTPIAARRGFDALFDEWYAIYPRHEEKAAAKVKFVTKLKAGVPFDALVAGAQRYRDDPNRDPQYTKQPTTWLNQGCWDDDPLPPRADARASGAAPTPKRPGW